MNQENKWATPAAIVAVGLLIAGAIYFRSGGGDSSGSADQDQPLKRVSLSGDISAPVTIIEYSDFQCPFCKKWHDEVGAPIMEEYVKMGKARFIYKDFAFLGQESTNAAIASKCALEQGENQFWDYHDYLFDNQKGENRGQFSVANLKRFAANLKLDTNKFNECLGSNKYKADVQKETEEGRAAGVDGTPAFLINGRLIVGAQPLSEFQKIIDEALVVAGKK